MIIRFLLPTTTDSYETIDLHVDLIDNPAVQSWKQHFSNNYITQAKITDLKTNASWDNNEIAALLAICNKNLQTLAAHGYPYHGPMIFDYAALDRNYTNKLHRYFTSTFTQVNHQIWADKSHEEHVIVKRYYSELLDEINGAVHNLEKFLEPNSECKFSVKEIYVNHEPYIFDTTWWELKSEWRQYHSMQHADIILGPQIQGKTILQSYLDNDDPNDPDTTGHYFSAGAIMVLPTQNRYQIYTSEDFKNWLTRHNLDAEKVYYDFPIGNVQNKATLAYLMTRLSQNPIAVHYIF